MTPVQATFAPQLTETLDAVRRRMQEGGSVVSVVAVLLGLALIVVVTYWLTRRQRDRSRGGGTGELADLFQRVVDELPIAPSQRKLLNTVAREIHAEHPTVMLLSPSTFDRHFHTWRARQRSLGGAKTKLAGEIGDLRSRLFPSGGSVASQPVAASAED